MSLFSRTYLFTGVFDRDALALIRPIQRVEGNTGVIDMRAQNMIRVTGHATSTEEFEQQVVREIPDYIRTLDENS